MSPTDFEELRSVIEENSVCPEVVDTPRKQRGKRNIRPHKTLTYDTLGECPEVAKVTSRRNVEEPSSSIVNLERESPVSPLDTSVSDTKVTVVGTQNSFPTPENWWEAPLSVLCTRLEAKMCSRNRVLHIFGDQRLKAGGVCSADYFCF